ncbi:MAG: hypothetical protein ACI9XO_001417 [Paraglaciecola sp.]|jgi:hypothetical protein
MKGLLLLLVVFWNWGCDEYISKYPISEVPDSEISSEFLGKWVSIEKDGKYLKTSKKIELLEWGDMEYLLLENEIGDKNTSPYKLWNSKINDVNYLNVYPLKQNKRDSIYFILKYRIRGDSLEYTPLKVLDSLGLMSLDSLNLTAEPRFDIKGNFKKYIEENQIEFDGFFKKEWTVFHRWENLDWKFINEGFIPDIISIKNDGDLVNKDSMLNEFANYYLLENTIYYFKLHRKSFFLKNSQGDTSEIIKTSRLLHDVENDKWYAPK